MAQTPPAGQARPGASLPQSAGRAAGAGRDSQIQRNRGPGDVDRAAVGVDGARAGRGWLRAALPALQWPGGASPIGVRTPPAAGRPLGRALAWTLPSESHPKVCVSVSGRREWRRPFPINSAGVGIAFLGQARGRTPTQVVQQGAVGADSLTSPPAVGPGSPHLELVTLGL